MSTNIETLQERLRERLSASGLSARAASIVAVRQPDAINNILNKRSRPTFERLLAIADALGTNVGYLIGTTNDPSADDAASLGVARASTAAAAPDPAPGPNFAEMDKDIPVYGTALGGEMNVADAPADGPAVELTDLDRGEVIDFLRRPPSLKRNRKVYGLYVVGSSMDPVYESGGVIIVDPTRPPAIRDYVVVYLRHRQQDAEGATAAVLIKRLVRRSGSYVELEQFNPAGTFRLPTADVKEMHRVLTVTEMLGV